MRAISVHVVLDGASATWRPVMFVSIFYPFCFFSVSGPDSIIWQAIWFCLQMMHSKLVNGVVVFHHEVAAKMKDKIVHIDL
jgi:hypothetical protein